MYTLKFSSLRFVKYNVQGTEGRKGNEQPFGTSSQDSGKGT